MARGGKGPFAVAEAYMGEEVLAELQSDALWTSARQEALDLSFTRKSSDAKFAATQSHEHVGGKPVKLSTAGHYGRGSASDSSNGLATKEPLPCEAPNCFVEFIVEHNAAQWEALFSGIRAAIRKEFANELPSKTGAFANVNDFLSDKLTWRDFLFTAPEIHLQAVQDSSADEGEAAGFCPMPIHYDGGRGFIVLSFSLWTSRVVRMWHADGAVTDMRAEPGHCYLANFIGVEHQVLHARGGGEAGRGHTSTAALGKFETVYFGRSATFRYNKCSNECRLWQGIEGRLCACACKAYAQWEATAAIALPCLEDLRARRDLARTRLAKKRRVG